MKFILLALLAYSSLAFADTPGKNPGDWPKMPFKYRVVETGVQVKIYNPGNVPRYCHGTLIESSDSQKKKIPLRGWFMKARRSKLSQHDYHREGPSEGVQIDLSCIEVADINSIPSVYPVPNQCDPNKIDCAQTCSASKDDEQVCENDHLYLALDRINFCRRSNAEEACLEFRIDNLSHKKLDCNVLSYFRAVGVDGSSVYVLAGTEQVVTFEGEASQKVALLVSAQEIGDGYRFDIDLRRVKVVASCVSSSLGSKRRLSEKLSSCSPMKRTECNYLRK